MTQEIEAMTPEQPDPGAEIEQMAEAHERLRRAHFDALFPGTDSKAVEHATRELKLAGLDQPDSDYGGMIADSVLDLVKVFAAQGHSGFSAGLALGVFMRVADFKALTYNDHSLYRDVGEYMGEPSGQHLQDVRESNWFSDDGGKTWHDVDAKRRHRKKGA